MALKGIDISSAQSGMNVATVDADFVIIKATQGTNYVNPYCNKHYQQAKAANKLRGVYHYANGGNALDEAAFFLKNASGYVKDAILCLDWESNLGGGHKNPYFRSSYAPTWIKIWCNEIYKKTGVKPLVYIQQSALSDVKGIGDYGLWIAQYSSTAATGYQDTPWNEGKYSCAIRQYSSNGRIAGYSGPLDLDKFYGDKAAWNKYANPSASKPVAPTANTDCSVYRLWNTKNGDHLFTTLVKERDDLVKTDWKYEGIAWNASTSGQPVYRLYRKGYGEHFYTVDKNERDTLLRSGTYVDEGVAFHAGNGQRVFRLCQKKNPYLHIYTTSETEEQSLTGSGEWKYEGVAFHTA